MQTPSHQKGILTLALTVVVLAIVTLTTLYTARVVVTDDKVFGSVYRNTEAMNAARAGFDYALGYLNANPGTVTTGLSSCSTGLETFSLSSGTLGNGATYAMTYGCVTAGSTTFISIASTGTSQDGSAVKTVRAYLKALSGSSTPAPVIAVGSVTNAATITNSLTGALYAIDSGGTVVNTGTLTPNATNQNNSVLTGLSSSDFTQAYTGQSLISNFGLLTPANYARIVCNGSLIVFDENTTYSALPSGCALSASAGLSGNVINNASAGLVYIQMTTAGSTLVFTNSTSTVAPKGKNPGVDAFYVMGAAGSQVVVVADFTGGGATTFDVRAAFDGNLDVINGNIYTNAAALIVDNTVAKKGTSLTVNGLLVRAESSTAPSPGISIYPSAGKGAVAINGEVVSNEDIIISPDPTLQIDTAALGLIANSYDGLVGSLAYNGISGGGGSYGLVAGSLKDF